MVINENIMNMKHTKIVASIQFQPEVVAEKRDRGCREPCKEDENGAPKTGVLKNGLITL